MIYDFENPPILCQTCKTQLSAANLCECDRPIDDENPLAVWLRPGVLYIDERRVTTVPTSPFVGAFAAQNPHQPEQDGATEPGRTAPEHRTAAAAHRARRASTTKQFSPAESWSPGEVAMLAALGVIALYFIAHLLLAGKFWS